MIRRTRAPWDIEPGRVAWACVEQRRPAGNGHVERPDLLLLMLLLLPPPLRLFGRHCHEIQVIAGLPLIIVVSV